ncbi:Ig-like domain-containing protein [Cellulomonas endophytica]|uniref:Ig-like domain-containing protein n=1 Tax=Cellulomonas endophytica TaxID=2494735 RepID=UPI001011F28C|nr:hypothetical protein [Cellulomonas endophytica]
MAALTVATLGVSGVPAAAAAEEAPPVVQGAVPGEPAPEPPGDEDLADTPVDTGEAPDGGEAPAGPAQEGPEPATEQRPGGATTDGAVDAHPVEESGAAPADAVAPGRPAPAEPAAGGDGQQPVPAADVALARDDELRGVALGTRARVEVLLNDDPTLRRESVRLVDRWGSRVHDLVVPGEGIWIADTLEETRGTLVFYPYHDMDGTYTGDPTPVRYSVIDQQGVQHVARASVLYRPGLAPDQSTGHAHGQPVTLAPLRNDRGSIDPATLSLVSPDGTPVDTSGVHGGTYTLDRAAGTVTFTPDPGFDHAQVPGRARYRVATHAGETDVQDIVVAYEVVARPDRVTAARHGRPVVVEVLANDEGAVDPATLQVHPADEPSDGSTLTVPGEGTWTVQPEAGTVTFTPQAGFRGTPAPVGYRIGDGVAYPDPWEPYVEGRSSITLEYAAPAAHADVSVRNTIGEPVTLDVLADDDGDVDPGTLVLLHPVDGTPTRRIVEGDQGSYSVDPSTGTVTFSPSAGYDPAVPLPDLRYGVTTLDGDVLTGTIAIDYAPRAADDARDGLPSGRPATVDVLANDRGALDVRSLGLVVPGPDGTTTTAGSVHVDGQGVWSTTPAGLVEFHPADGFTGSPAPVTYQVANGRGVTTVATVAVTYERVVVVSPTPTGPTAPTTPVLTAPVVSEGNAHGRPATLPIRTRVPDAVGSTLWIRDPGAAPAVGAGASAATPDAPYRLVKGLVVQGQGVWTVDDTAATITFVPEAGLAGNPDAIEWQVEDSAGQVRSATATVLYLAAASTPPVLPIGALLTLPAATVAAPTAPTAPTVPTVPTAPTAPTAPTQPATRAAAVPGAPRTGGLASTGADPGTAGALAVALATAGAALVAVRRRSRSQEA